MIGLQGEKQRVTPQQLHACKRSQSREHPRMPAQAGPETAVDHPAIALAPREFSSALNTCVDVNHSLLHDPSHQDCKAGRRKE